MNLALVSLVRNRGVVEWKRTVREILLRERNKLYELAVRKRLLTIRGGLFWDIGASIGFYSFCLRKNFEKIVAIEPNPRTAYMLRRRVKFCLVRNIDVKQVALSNCRGWLPLYSQREWRAGPGVGNLIAGISYLYSSDSLLSRFEYRSARDLSGKSDKVREHRPNLRVWAERFDDLVTGPVELVKIDVEGAEFLVLDGMRKSLRTSLIGNILVELHDRDNKTRLESILSSYDYTVEWADPEHLLATAP